MPEISQGCWEHSATRPRSSTWPTVFVNSPSSAASKLDLPVPTAPTTAASCPPPALKSIAESTGGLPAAQVKVARSIVAAPKPSLQGDSRRTSLPETASSDLPKNSDSRRWATATCVSVATARGSSCRYICMICSDGSTAFRQPRTTSPRVEGSLAAQSPNVSQQRRTLNSAIDVKTFSAVIAPPSSE